MAVSTTLITFMVRTPPTTLSVALYGSWDNFSTPYPMLRDVRLGKEHWSGCHNFENIICDGTTDTLTSSRNGGLKMGGTYWYYYKLDDDIEFHNSAEPATTRCPMLPGQIVNELQVPVVLSGSRKRDASVSSTSSERRTLDPEAKFTNPQPVPTPPTLMRLNTSPTLLEALRANSGGSTNPYSAAPLLQSTKDYLFSTTSAQVFHLPRKPSLDALMKVKSVKANPAGMRKAFQSTDTDQATSPSEKYQDIINWIPERQVDTNYANPAEFEPAMPPRDTDQNSTETAQFERLKPPHGALLLRSHSEEAVPLASFSAHRRQKSTNRSQITSTGNATIFDESVCLDLSSHRGVEQGLLSTLLEVSTPECTPGYGPETGRRMTLEALEGRKESHNSFEKRLPSLPTTPSSARLAPAFISPPRKLDSRFSASTFESNNRLAGVVVHEQPQDRSSAYDDATIWSPLSASTIEDSICSPFIAEGFTVPALRPISINAAVLSNMSDNDYYQDQRLRASTLTCTTISSSLSTTPTTSHCDDDTIDNSHFSDVTSHCSEAVGRYPDTSSRCSDATSFSGVTSIRSSAVPYTAFQHYSLPEIENASEVTLKRFEPQEYSRVDDSATKRVEDERRDSVLSHSDNMRKLINELSYLSGMIQH